MTGEITPARPERRLARVADLALRVAGAVVSLLGGLVVAVVSLVAVPWRIDLGFGLVRMPLAVLFAVAGTAALLWFAPRVTGVRAAVLLPALGWFTVALAGMRTTREGSYLLMPNDLVAALTLFGGTVVIVVGLVLTLTGGRRPPVPGHTSDRRGGPSATRTDPPPSRTRSL